MTLAAEWWDNLLPLLATVLGGAIVLVSNLILERRREKREDERRHRDDQRDALIRLRALHENVGSLMAKHVDNMTYAFAMTSPPDQSPDAVERGGAAYNDARASMLDVEMAITRGVFRSPDYFSNASNVLVHCATVLPIGAGEDALSEWMEEAGNAMTAWSIALNQWVTDIENATPEETTTTL